MRSAIPVDSDSRLKYNSNCGVTRHNQRCDLIILLLTINVVTCDDCAREDQDILTLIEISADLAYLLAEITLFVHPKAFDFGDKKDGGNALKYFCQSK